MLTKTVASDQRLLCLSLIQQVFEHINKSSNCLFVCVEVLWPSQPNGVMSSTSIVHSFVRN